MNIAIFAIHNFCTNLYGNIGTSEFN